MKSVMNYYECPRCQEHWEDEWDCACDDQCPKCSLGGIEPYESRNAHAVEYAQIIGRLTEILGSKGKVAMALGIYPNAINHRLKNPDVVKYEHVLAADALLRLEVAA